jgi:hypothetical protein
MINSHLYGDAPWLQKLDTEVTNTFGGRHLTLAQSRDYVDAHISVMLAVAIGWDAYEDLQVILPGAYELDTRCEAWSNFAWRTFSYHDETVTGPIAAKYGVTLTDTADVGSQGALWTAELNGTKVQAENKNKAIALLLINLTNAYAVWSDGAAPIALQPKLARSTCVSTGQWHDLRKTL